ncbi:MAG TPA: hypothetical protein PK854_06625 [Oscillospiraceae bacterium]|nr:hypothetical protein [Oscillospiraceae bacterium]HPS34921.1 hypothetical protein [Oscillospiraceae bacterium]
MIEIGKQALTALTLLKQAGYPSYIVGGCLRDLLLGKKAQDYDLATPATPQQTLVVFNGFSCFRQGEKFGTIGVLIGGEKFEITTYRSDIGYTDGRHPDLVVFTGNILDDLSRRDFTINSVACGIDGELIDPYGGLADIKNKILKATGDAKIRFNEDALRILRLFRFSAQLGFEIEDNTLGAAVQYKTKLLSISKERIGTEFLRLLSCDCAYPLKLMSEEGILEIIGINQVRETKQIQACPNDSILRLAALIYLSQSDPKRVFAALKLSNVQKELCNTFLNELSRTTYQSKTEFKHNFISLAPEQWKTLLLAEAVLGQDIGAVWDYVDQIEFGKEPYQLSQLALNGNDLRRMGYEGKEIGRALKKTLDYVLEHPRENTKEKLLNLLRK